MDDPLCDLVFDNMPDAKGGEGGSDQEDEVDEEDCEEETRFVPEFVRNHPTASPSRALTLTDKLGIDSSNRWGNSNTTVRH